MQDASGVDLIGRRGWFFSIDAVDVSLDSIKWYKVDLENNPERKEYTYTDVAQPPSDHVSKTRNKEAGMKYAIDEDPALRDFYVGYKPWEGPDSVVTTTTWLYDELLQKKREARKIWCQ